MTLLGRLHRGEVVEEGLGFVVARLGQQDDAEQQARIAMPRRAGQNPAAQSFRSDPVTPSIQFGGLADLPVGRRRCRVLHNASESRLKKEKGRAVRTRAAQSDTTIPSPKASG